MSPEPETTWSWIATLIANNEQITFTFDSERECRRKRDVILQQIVQKYSNAPNEMLASDCYED